ncbi:TPA: phage holin family protein [Proteus mirabilis]
MKRMPEKFEWEQILRWLQSVLPLLGGFTIATTIAYIRERQAGSQWKRSLGEAVMCACLVLELFGLLIGGYHVVVMLVRGHYWRNSVVL